MDENKEYLLLLEEADQLRKNLNDLRDNMILNFMKSLDKLSESSIEKDFAFRIKQEIEDSGDNDYLSVLRKDLSEAEHKAKHLQDIYTTAKRFHQATINFFEVKSGGKEPGEGETYPGLMEQAMTEEKVCREKLFSLLNEYKLIEKSVEM